MTKLEQTNAVLDLINEGLNNGKLNNEEIIGMALLDIAKSLAIIADGVMTQNEQMQKIEKDIEESSKREENNLYRWDGRKWVSKVPLVTYKDGSKGYGDGRVYDR